MILEYFSEIVKKKQECGYININIEAIFARDGGNTGLKKAKGEASGTDLFLTHMCLHEYSLWAKLLEVTLYFMHCSPIV